MKNSSALQINEDIKKNWEIVQQKLKETYGLDVYKSWIQNVEANSGNFKWNFSAYYFVIYMPFRNDYFVENDFSF